MNASATRRTVAPPAKERFEILVEELRSDFRADSETRLLQSLKAPNCYLRDLSNNDGSVTDVRIVPAACAAFGGGGLSPAVKTALAKSPVRAVACLAEAAPP